MPKTSLNNFSFTSEKKKYFPNHNQIQFEIKSDYKKYNVKLKDIMKNKINNSNNNNNHIVILKATMSFHTDSNLK